MQRETQELVRPPAHPSITEENISLMVDTFYQRIGADSRLGPIFTRRNEGHWTPHLDKMKQFWRSVLLKTGEYKGSPPAVHMAIEELQEDDFTHWLELFKATSADIFEPEAAEITDEFATRIARSLWLSCFGDAFSNPPF